MNFKSQLLSLIKEAHKYQYADVNDSHEDIEHKRPRWYFTKVQYGLILCAVVISSTMNGCFNESFAGYVMSGLSLFAGLFFSFILMLIDMFRKIDFEPYKKTNNAGLMPLGVRLKNYYKKATTLSFYIILLALISILLLSFSLFDVNIEQTWGLETCILACPTLQEAKKIS